MICSHSRRVTSPNCWPTSLSWSARLWLLPGLFVLLKWLYSQSERTSFYRPAARIADNKPLAVCDNHRIRSNKVLR